VISGGQPREWRCFECIGWPAVEEGRDLERQPVCCASAFYFLSFYSIVVKRAARQGQ
jgi:hypothetical protein